MGNLADSISNILKPKGPKKAESSIPPSGKWQHPSGPPSISKIPAAKPPVPLDKQTPITSPEWVHPSGPPEAKKKAKLKSASSIVAEEGKNPSFAKF